MKITIPVTMEIDNGIIKEVAQGLGGDLEQFRKGLIEDKVELLCSLVVDGGYEVNAENIKVEE